MKKIINWTFGSVFRTFGRIIAYILIGLLAFLLIQKNDLKITDLLGIYKVKADTITSWTTQQARVQTTHDGTDIWTNWTNISGDNATIFSNLTNPVKAIAWRVKTNNGMSNLNVYSFKFSYKPTPDAIHPSSYYMQNDTTGEQEEITCTITRNESSGYYWYDCSFQPQTSYTSSDYLYIKINFTLSYLTEIRMSMRGYDERKGTNAVITEQTNNIITNNEQNTQEIINSLNDANENLLNGLTEQNQVCEIINNQDIVINGKILNVSGQEIANEPTGITGYINIYKAKITILDKWTFNDNLSWCYYDENKNLISCQKEYNITELNIPQNAYYFRATIHNVRNIPVIQICRSGNQALNDSVNDLLHDINDKDTETALNGYKDFFNLFTNNGHGLTSIVTAPLNAINSLTNTTCSPLVLPLPYMQNKNITLPCMRPIYEEHFGNFMILYDTVTFGIISYWVILKLFKLIKNFKNPEDEGIEVVDL